MTMIPAAFADRFIENKIEMKMGKFAIIFARKDTGEKHKAIFEFKDMVVDGNYVRIEERKNEKGKGRSILGRKS